MTRTDKRKNLSKVASEVLNNPLASQREIANNAWIWLWTANRAVKELEQNGTKDPDILMICETDKTNVILWQNELQRRLKEEADKMKTSDIVQVIQEWTKRYTMFKGNVTDKEWWLRINEEDLED